MTTPDSVRTLRAWLLITLAPVALCAQPATSESTDPEDESVLLNPFEVRADRDVGFVASSSLAGGRLTTDLRDTPAAYSVITREFIEALNITDLAEAAEWAPNSVVLVSGNGGGYGDDVSNNPGSYNVRGGGNGRQQRNFFVYNAPMDSYAIERFDFGRGPNAILFGNGSLGGVSSSMTKRARLDRSFTNASFGFGSWDRYRSVIDVNRPINDKLAVRAAAMWSDKKGWRDRQFDKNDAIFLTGTWKVGPNTSVRLEGEYGTNSRNQTFHNITDQFSGWDGVTTFSGRLDTLPSNANSIGVGRRGAGFIVYDPYSGVNAVMNYQNQPITLGGGANGQVPIGGFVSGSGPGFNTANSTILHAINVPENRFDNAIAGSSFRIPKDSFTMAFDTHTIKQRFNDIQLTVDHRIGNIFFQLAVDRNRTRQSINTPDVRNAGQTLIDINRVLPNGDPNPHFLVPYSDSLYRKTEDARDADGLRLAAGTTKDFGKWGNFTFNVMGGYTETRDTKLGAYLLSTGQNPDRRRWGASGASLGRTDGIFLRSYWNESKRPYTAPESVRYINPLTGVDTTITPFWALESDRSDSFQLTRAEYAYGIAAVSARFFDRRLVFLGAVRADDFYSHTKQQLHGGDYSPTEYDASYGLYKPNAPDDYRSLTYQLKNASGTVLGPAISADTRPRDGNGNRAPQYLDDRFKDDYNAPAIKKLQMTKSVGAVFHVQRWLSPYINYAETFNPPPAIQRIDSSFLEPTVAKGIDAGVRMSFLKNRMMVNMLHYRNSEINNPMDHGLQSTLNGLLSANVKGDFTAGGRNMRDIPNAPGVLRDIRDREADGYEMEITANMTKSLRLVFNVGLPKVYETNSFQDMKKYLSTHGDVLRQIVIDAGGLVDSENVATVDTSVPVDERSPDVNTAVANYNTLMNNQRNFIDGKRLVQDQPTLNIYGDYTFNTGRLSGLRLGGGWQYREPQIIGSRVNETIVNPADPTRAIDDPRYDAYDAAYAPNSYSNVVATIAYTWKLADKREISFNLRIDNVLDDRTPLWAAGVTGRPENGDYTSPARKVVPTTFALRAPRSFFLTTVVKF